MSYIIRWHGNIGLLLSCLILLDFYFCVKHIEQNQYLVILLVLMILTIIDCKLI